MKSIIYTGENLLAYSLLKILPLVILGVLIYFMIQRQFNNQGKKRLATLYWAILLGILEGGAYLIFRNGKPDWLLIPLGAGLIITAILLRKKIFPFKSKCDQCGKKLKLITILMKEDSLCDQCHKDQKIV